MHRQDPLDVEAEGADSLGQDDAVDTCNDLFRGEHIEHVSDVQQL